MRSASLGPFTGSIDRHPHWWGLVRDASYYAYNVTSLWAQARPRRNSARRNEIVVWILEVTVPHHLCMPRLRMLGGLTFTFLPNACWHTYNLPRLWSSLDFIHNYAQSHCVCGFLGVCTSDSRGSERWRSTLPATYNKSVWHCKIGTVRMCALCF